MSDPGPHIRKSIYRGKFLDFGMEHVVLPDGQEIELEVLRHPGAAAVLPVLEDGRVVLIRQFRHATGGWLVEVPAGKLDLAESPEACALRETEEEVGYKPGRLTSLGWIWSSPGFTDEKLWLFRADQLTPGTQDLEHDEHIEIVRVPLEEAVRQARSGEIVDAKTVCCLLRA